MGSADDDVPMVASPPSAERRRTLQRSASTPKLRRQSRLPANLAVTRGACLALVTMLLTVGVVLSLHVGMGGGITMRKRAESAVVDVWGHAERALNSTNATAWRDVVLASFSQWHGTRRGASALLVNATEELQARDDTVTVVEEVPLDPNRERTKHRNPRDTSWQQFTVVRPAGVEVRSVWDGSDAVKEYMAKPKSEDAPPASLHEAIGWDLEPFKEGIKEGQIEQLYCGLGEASLRIQIINNLGYVVGESKSRYQRRHHRLKVQIQEFIDKYQGDWLPPNTDPPHGTRNVDFVLWTGDAHPPDERVEGTPDGQGPCEVKWGPMFSTGRRAEKRSSDFVVLVSDEIFLSGLPELDISPWKELQPKVWAIKTTNVWGQRRPEIQFRGARSTPARLELFENTALLESPLTDFAFTDAGEDGAAGFVSKEDGFLHPTESCGTRYILYMEGRTSASSLRYALACGSVVLWPRDPLDSREEFFHPMLKDGIQLRILDPVTPENKGQHILTEVERLEVAAKDSNLTARMAKRAGAFADYRLAGGAPYDEWRLQYWKEVVNQYAVIQSFTLKEPHADAVPLVDSIARGEHYTDLPDLADARNCTACKAFGWGLPEQAARYHAAEDTELKEFNKRRAKVGKAASTILARRRVERQKAAELKAEAERKEAEEKERKEKAEREERDAEQRRAEEDMKKAEKEKERAALEADEAALQAAKAKEEAEKAEKGVADERAEQLAENAEKAAKAKEEAEKAEKGTADGKGDKTAEEREGEDAAKQMAEDAAKAAADRRKLLAAAPRVRIKGLFRRSLFRRPNSPRTID